MTSLTGYKLAACQYDEYPLIMYPRHELFRSNFLARCVELKDAELTSVSRGDGFSSTVTYVHDSDYDGNLLNSPVWRDLETLLGAPPVKGAKVSVFHMRPGDRVEMIDKVLAMKYEPEPLKMFNQLPDLVNVLLCNKAVADVRRTVHFWDQSVTHRIKCAQAGVWFGFPGRKTQGECVPRVLLDNREAVVPVLEALPLALYMFIYAQLARHQLSPYAIDGLVHSTMHGLMHGAGASGQTFRSDEATLHIDTINDILNMQIVLRASLDGSLPRQQIDPLLLAVIKRANRIYDIMNPKREKYFNAYALKESKEAKKRAEDLQGCVTESKRVWRTRLSMEIDVDDAVVQLRRHYAFQQAADLKRFVAAAPSVVVIQVVDCTAYSITAALLRYVSRAEFFIAEYRSSRSCQAATILALSPDILWVYKRATMVRFLVEQRTSVGGSKTAISFDFMPLAPMLLGMVVCEKPKPLASRVFVDTLRDWLQLRRLPVFNDATPSKQQSSISTRCDLAVQGLLVLGKARRLLPMHSMAIMLLVLALLEDDSVRITERPSGGGPLSELFETLLGRPDAKGKTQYSMSGLELWEKVVRGLIRDAATLDDGKSESKKPYLALLRLVRVGEISLETLMGRPANLADRIPDLATQSTSVYTVPKLQRQFTDSVKIEDRKVCKHRPVEIHHLFALIGLVEQQSYNDYLGTAPRRVLPLLTDEKQLNLGAEQFVASMIVREPPVALVRTDASGRVVSLYPGDYVCAWPVDRDTDGGLCNENLDLSDRALFFNWLWSPLFKSNADTWVVGGLMQFTRRMATAKPSTDYDSDDECMREVACSRLLLLQQPSAAASRVLPMDATAAVAAVAAAAATATETKRSGTDNDVFGSIYDGSDDEEELTRIRQVPSSAVEEEEEEEEAADSPDRSDKKRSSSPDRSSSGGSRNKRTRSRSPSPSSRPSKTHRMDKGS